MEQNITVSMFTDSLSQFDVTTKATVTTATWIMIDLKSVYNVYYKEENADGPFIPTNLNPVDAINELKKDFYLLET